MRVCVRVVFPPHLHLSEIGSTLSFAPFVFFPPDVQLLHSPAHSWALSPFGDEGHKHSSAWMRRGSWVS